MSVLGNEEPDDLFARRFTTQELSTFYFALEDRKSFRSYQAWNKALWREAEITTRINSMIKSGEWGSGGPVGWATDLLAEDHELPDTDSLETRRQKPRPKLAILQGGKNE